MFGFFYRLTCIHEFGRWRLAERHLYGPYGHTVDEVQRRECVHCGHTQQREIENVKAA